MTRILVKPAEYGDGSISTCVLGLSLLGVTLSAQSRPDFSGRWTPVNPTGVPHVLVVTQDATSLVAERSEGTCRTSRSKAEGTILSVRDDAWSLDGEGRLVIEVTTRRPGGQSSATKGVYRRVVNP